MAAALENQPAIPFRIPEGVRLVRLNVDTGLPARPGDNKVILEAFKPGTLPSGERVVIDGGYNPLAGTEPAASGARGIY